MADISVSKTSLVFCKMANGDKRYLSLGMAEEYGSDSIAALMWQKIDDLFQDSKFL
jgi:hypothetical protein